jgi:predicted regulator of Ras-like GTPase activity (Roadblock/LC7/MglB family)
MTYRTSSTVPGRHPQDHSPPEQNPHGQGPPGQGLLGSFPVGGLDWLLDGLRERVPGIAGAVLASRDGIRLAVTGLSGDQADREAAVVCGLLSMARGTGAAIGWSGGVRQVVVEHDEGMLFVMATGGHASAGLEQRPRIVDSVLGVLATSEADPRLVGAEMAALAGSVAEHLVTAIRTGGAPEHGGR